MRQTPFRHQLTFCAPLALAALLCTTGAHAQATPSLQDRLQKNNCLACHGIDKKIVGPSFKDVATKYRSDAAAPAKLLQKIKAGGSGAWGAIPMPPQTLKDDEAQAIVKLILQLK